MQLKNMQQLLYVNLVHGIMFFMIHQVKLNII